jgi:HSP20 family protein
VTAHAPFRTEHNTKGETAMSIIPWTNRLARWREPSPVFGFRREMDRLFERFFNGWPELEERTEALAAWTPSTDIVENDDAFMVRAELPGVQPEKVKVELIGNYLQLSGEKEEAKEEKRENFFLTERSFGAFKRGIELPSTVELERITAEYDKGVLTIRVPKKATAKPKQVNVEVKPEQKTTKRVPVGAA